MKKFKLSAMLLFAAMIMFSACGGGGGGGSDDPGVPGDPNYTIEIKPDNATLYLNCEYEFYAIKENDSKHLDNISWEVDDASVAKIDADGNLTPLKAGKFNVTGTTGEGEIGIAECTVTATAVSNVFESSAGVVTKYKGSDKNVAIPASIKGVVINSIGENAFSQCSYLENIEIPLSVTSIANSAFWNCSSLKCIVIPSGITSIADSAFCYCSSLNSIEVDLLNNKYKDIDGVLYSKIGNLLLCVPNKRILSGTYCIPSDVTSIANSAFLSCSNLKNIDIPSGVTNIDPWSFCFCVNLENIDLPYGITSIGVGVFSDCTSLKSIEIPSSVTTIGDQAFFECISLESVKVEAVDPPDLYSNSFSSCSKLAKIEVPSASLSKYKTADGWKNFATKIVGF